MAAGAVATTTTANATGPEAWEINVPFNAGVTSTTIRNLLVAGTNTIAVELHQQSTSSTDSAFDMSLVATSASGVLANDNVAAPLDQPFFRSQASRFTALFRSTSSAFLATRRTRTSPGRTALSIA